MNSDHENLFHEIRKTVASGTHQCTECRCLIPPGTRYFRCAGIGLFFFGIKLPWSAKLCTQCMADWDTLITIEFRQGNTSGIIYGELAQRIHAAQKADFLLSDELVLIDRWPAHSAQLRHHDERQGELLLDGASIAQ